MARKRKSVGRLAVSNSVVIFQDRGIADQYAEVLKEAIGGTSTVYKNVNLGLADDAKDGEIFNTLAESSQASKTIVLTNDLSKGDNGMKRAQDEKNTQDSHMISVELSQNFRLAPKDMASQALHDKRFINALYSENNVVQKIRVTGGTNGSPINYKVTLRNGKTREWEYRPRKK